MTTTTIAERPILFSGPMVRAILRGEKTQTRRVVTPQPQPFNLRSAGPNERFWHFNEKRGVGKCYDGCFAEAKLNGLVLPFCPFGKPGDRLWVRETFGLLYSPLPKTGKPALSMRYAADDALLPLSYGNFPDRPADACLIRLGKHPSIHMPRWASRLTLEITSIRVERLQDISEEDARAEGVEPNCAVRGDLSKCSTCAVSGECSGKGQYLRYGADMDSEPAYNALESFRSLWDSINAARGYGWDKSPWVWVVEFRLA